MDERPVLFVAGHVPPYRVGGLERLHASEGIELALFGGRLRHGGGATPEGLPFPHTRTRPGQLFSLAASGRYRAVVCPTAGRLAPVAAWAGARRARVPVILWASLWAHPLTPPHAISFLALRRLYRSADAVVTYGTHVSAYVGAHGARNIFVAPQSVDNEFWRATAGAPRADELPGWPAGDRTRFLFVGRDDAEKGLAVLLAAWERAAPRAHGAALVIVGLPPGSQRVGRLPAAVVSLGRLGPEALRGVYGASDVLVVPSVRTRTFREPWGLVVNEAMNQGLAVIATDAVGAAAGGLVREDENGLVVAAGDSRALAEAIATLACDADTRTRMGEEGARDVLAFDHDAWAGGFSRALASLGVSRGRW